MVRGSGALADALVQIGPPPKPAGRLVIGGLAQLAAELARVATANHLTPDQDATDLSADAENRHSRCIAWRNKLT